MQQKTATPINWDEATVPELAEAKDGDIKRVVEMANQLLEKADEIAEAEATLKKLKAQYLSMETEDLPNLMAEIGLELIKLESGHTVEVTKDVKTGITKANEPAAFKWLTENGFGGLIKTEVKLTFGSGEKDEAIDAFTHLREEHQNAELKEAIHAATLKSFIKEQLENGNEIPTDIFSIHPFNRAAIKKAKTKKGK